MAPCTGLAGAAGCAPPGMGAPCAGLAGAVGRAPPGVGARCAGLVGAVGRAPPGVGVSCAGLAGAVGWAPPGVGASCVGLVAAVVRARTTRRSRNRVKMRTGSSAGTSDARGDSSPEAGQQVKKTKMLAISSPESLPTLTSLCKPSSPSRLDGSVHEVGARSKTISHPLHPFLSARSSIGMIRKSVRRRSPPHHQRSFAQSEP